MTKEERIETLRNLGIVNESQIQKLDEMGFFTAPASTKYHGNYEGGLFDHSLEVAKALVHLTENYVLSWKRGISPLLVGMFHDLCKCDQYESHVDPEGVPYYSYSKNVILTGHGEKSVMLLSQFFTLTEEEILCIRYHMGAYNTDEWNQYDLAIRKYPTVLFTHTADMIASKITGV
jgi:hypothetical protein